MSGIIINDNLTARAEIIYDGFEGEYAHYYIYKIKQGQWILIHKLHVNKNIIEKKVLYKHFGLKFEEITGQYITIDNNSSIPLFGVQYINEKNTIKLEEYIRSIYPIKNEKYSISYEAHLYTKEDTNNSYWNKILEERYYKRIDEYKQRFKLTEKEVIKF